MFFSVLMFSIGDCKYLIYTYCICRKEDYFLIKYANGYPRLHNLSLYFIKIILYFEYISIKYSFKISHFFKINNTTQQYPIPNTIYPDFSCIAY